MNINAIRAESELKVASSVPAASLKQKANAPAPAGGAVDTPAPLSRRSDVLNLAAETTPPAVYVKPPITPPPAQTPPATSALAAQPAPASPGTPSAAPDASVSFTQQDLDSVLASYGSRNGDSLFNAAFDFNADGAIGFDDLNHVLSHFNAAPAAAAAPPAAPPAAPAVATTEAEPAPVAPAAAEVPGAAPAAQPEAAANSTPEPVFSQGDLPSLLFAYGRRTGEAGFEARFDFNNDGVIGFDDLNSALSRISPGAAQHASTLEGLVQAFGLREGQEGFNAKFDFDADGHIGFSDLNQLLDDLFSDE